MELQPNKNENTQKLGFIRCFVDFVLYVPCDYQHRNRGSRDKHYPLLAELRLRKLPCPILPSLVLNEYVDKSSQRISGQQHEPHDVYELWCFNPMH